MASDKTDLFETTSGRDGFVHTSFVVLGHRCINELTESAKLTGFDGSNALSA